MKQTSTKSRFYQDTLPGLAPSRPKLSQGRGKLAHVPFSYVDLFAGIGGFHAALDALGGECWFASEIDSLAKRVYERNWGLESAGDLVPLTEDCMEVPPHDLLAAGFPCQPFSKSGYQRGINETRGTLFFNIARVLEERHPAVVLLENVRNLAGPRHRDTWSMIVGQLRDLGYRVSGVPTVFSPHLLPPDLGGRPQVRERVFILATYVGSSARAWREAVDEPVVPNRPVGEWNPAEWDLAQHLPLQDDEEIADLPRYQLSASECRWIAVWDDLVDRVRDDLDGDRLPGFPIWADAFVADPVIASNTPTWKRDFLEKNAAWYRRHRRVIDAWLDDHDGLQGLPPSRRKLEWQAQDAASLWDTVMHFRPSGIRVKRPTYLPALVAITQTSIVGPRRRRITPREAARLQGLPDWFSFAGQPDAATYRQLGNGVNVGAAYYVLRQHVLADADDIAGLAPGLVEKVVSAALSPDEALQARPFAVTAQRGNGRTVVDLAGQPELTAR
jgi:DNA (cytosine-5)-methyltransferase 1